MPLYKEKWSSRAVWGHWARRGFDSSWLTLGLVMFLYRSGLGAYVFHFHPYCYTRIPSLVAQSIKCTHEKKTPLIMEIFKKVQKSRHNSIMNSMYPSPLSTMIDAWPILFHLCPIFISHPKLSFFKANAQTQHLFIPGRQAFWTPLCSGLCTGGCYEGFKNVNPALCRKDSKTHNKAMV